MKVCWVVGEDFGLRVESSCSRSTTGGIIRDVFSMKGVVSYKLKHASSGKGLKFRVLKMIGLTLGCVDVLGELNLPHSLLPPMPIVGQSHRKGPDR